MADQAKRVAGGCLLCSDSSLCLPTALTWCCIPLQGLVHTLCMADSATGWPADVLLWFSVCSSPSCSGVVAVRHGTPTAAALVWWRLLKSFMFMLAADRVKGGTCC